MPFSRDTLTPTVGHSRPISLKKDPTNFSLFYRPYQRMPRYDMAVAMTEKIPLEGSFLPAGGPWENDDNSLTVLHVKMEIEASLSLSLSLAHAVSLFKESKRTLPDKMRCFFLRKSKDASAENRFARKNDCTLREGKAPTLTIRHSIIL